MKKMIMIMFVILGAAGAQASNTILDCSITEGGMGLLSIEQWHAEGATTYTVDYEAANEELVELGKMDVKAIDGNGLVGVFYGKNNSIQATLIIDKNGEGEYYRVGVTQNSDVAGLNLVFSVQSCKNPQL